MPWDQFGTHAFRVLLHKLRVIARGHDKSASSDTTLAANPELPLILEAIRCHPAAGINDLPPLPPSQRP